MERVLFILNGTPVAVADLVVGAAALGLLLLAIIAWNLGSGARARSLDAQAASERQREMQRAMEAISRQNAGLTGWVRSVADVLGSR